MNAAQPPAAVVLLVGLAPAGGGIMRPAGGDGATGASGRTTPRVEVRARTDDGLGRIAATVRPADDVPLPAPPRGAIQDTEIERRPRVDAGEFPPRVEPSTQRAVLPAAAMERTLREAGLASESDLADLQLRLAPVERPLPPAREAVEENTIRAPGRWPASPARPDASSAGRCRAGATAGVEFAVTGVNPSMLPAMAVFEHARAVHVFRIERGRARSTPVEKDRVTDG